MNYNKCTFVGRITSDCEYRVFESGTSLARFRIAVNDRISEKTLYLSVSLFGKMADRLKEKLNKGVQLLVDGRLELDTVTGEDGKKRDFYGLVADKIEIDYATFPSTVVTPATS
jgi:single-strand DNA-binding protein